MYLVSYGFITKLIGVLDVHPLISMVPRAIDPSPCCFTKVLVPTPALFLMDFLARPLTRAQALPSGNERVLPSNLATWVK